MEADQAATGDVATTDTGTTADTETTSAAPDLAAEVEKWKALSRKHEKQAKDNAAARAIAEKRQADLKRVAEALGLPAGDTAPDASAITAQLDAAKAEARARSVELAVHRAAGRLDADGDALLDSRQFLGSLDGLDPGDHDAIADAIKAAVKANPKLGRGSAAPAVPAQRQVSGGEFAGAPGGNGQWTADDVARATPAALSKAMKEGKLAVYLSS